MPVQLDLSGLNTIVLKCETLAAHDFTPLVEQWKDVLHDDNEFGVLHGLDGLGSPLAPVTYRPVDPSKRKKPVDYAILPHNNLTISHYRSLGGPPLAPRGLNSRIATNFRTTHVREASNQWAALGAWEDVLDVKGRPFLRYHFAGAGNMPKRDLRGVRPTALDRARRETLAYVEALLASL